MLQRLIPFFAVAVLGLASAQSQIEIFSWWAGNESPPLDALIAQFEADHPGVEVINATVTGGSGVNARAVLKTRMLGGDPPDSFQVHAGQELIGTWVVADRMEDLTFLYEEMGWFEKYPQGLIDASSTADGIWSVPVNIHRSNVMWYVPAKLEAWGITAPATWDAFLDMCPTIQAAGVTPLALGENWTHNHLWESVALGVLGPDDYDKLWTAELPFNDPKAMAVWDVFGEVLACTNDDAAGLSWQQATDLVADGSAAFNIMGDWAMGYLTTTLGLEPGVGYGWAPSPGTDGIFMWLSDAFGLPKGIDNREATLDWLRFIGTAMAQDVFNPIKGSIAPHLDSDPSLYNAYLQSAAADWQSNRVVGSLAHGTVAKEAFASDFATVMEIYLATGSAMNAGNAAQAIATQVGLGQ